VHHQHGVGKYDGMVKRTIGGIERDYLLVSYKGGDKLYVPSDQIDTLRQYVGGEAPTLHRLGGSDFAKAKTRVRSEVRQIAQELVLLYQQRVNAEGYAFGIDTPWQSEMEDSFPFVETPDQQRAIDDIKVDMERFTSRCKVRGSPHGLIMRLTMGPSIPPLTPSPNLARPPLLCFTAKTGRLPTCSKIVSKPQDARTWGPGMIVRRGLLKPAMLVRTCTMPGSWAAPFTWFMRRQRKL
jgi:hypothetical protein